MNEFIQLAAFGYHVSRSLGQPAGGGPMSEINKEFAKMESCKVWRKTNVTQMEKDKRCVKCKWVFQIERNGTFRASLVACVFLSAFRLRRMAQSLDQSHDLLLALTSLALLFTLLQT